MAKRLRRLYAATPDARLYLRFSRGASSRKTYNARRVVYPRAYFRFTARFGHGVLASVAANKNSDKKGIVITGDFQRDIRSRKSEGDPSKVSRPATTTL